MLSLPDLRVRQRDFLLQISRAITAQLDVDEVLRRVLQASAIMTNAQVGLVALSDESGVFVPRATVGLEAEHLPKIAQHLAGVVELLKTEPAREVLEREMQVMAQMINPDLRQALTLPLAFAGRALGLLIVFRAYASTITGDEIQVLQSFADQAAIAVNNAQLYAVVAQERRQLQAILDHSADGVFILDRDLVIRQFNEALVRMTGWSVAEAVGAPHDSIIQWDSGTVGSLREAIEAGYPFNSPVEPAHNTLYVEGDLRQKNGQTLSVGITYAPMLSADNNALAQIVANVRDITNFRQAQETQNTFISVVSHELKTPVAIIKGYAATLQRDDGDWDGEIVRETLKVIEDEADRLTGLIQDLLTASKIQAQRGVSLDLGDVWLPELAERVAARFRSQTTKHPLVLKFQNNYPHVIGDEAKLRQVLENLVSNAIKYSPNGGSIEIGGRYDAQWASVYIRDQGVGIAQADQERIFDRFYRVEGVLRKATPGTGLGLYLAKAIIDAHHGILDVESKLGEGSTFHLRLPRHP
jgi:PAS domain S-box-containing protein